MISIRVLVALVLLAVFEVTNAMPKPTKRSLAGRLNIATASAQHTNQPGAVSANNTRCELPSSPAAPSTTLASARTPRTPRTHEGQARNTLLTNRARANETEQQTQARLVVAKERAAKKRAIPIPHGKYIGAIPQGQYIDSTPRRYPPLRWDEVPPDIAARGPEAVYYFPPLCRAV